MINLFVLADLGSTNVTGVVEGDDGLFRYLGPLVTSEHFRNVGFVIKISQADGVNEASFCGIVYDDLDCLNVTNPISGLLEFGWGSSRYSKSSKRTKLKLLRSKALSLIYSYPGCPILQSLGMYALRITEGLPYLVPSNLNLYEREEMSMCLQYIKKKGYPIVRVPDRTRMLVEKLYGIPISVQRSVESKLDSLHTLQPLDFPELLPFCKDHQLHFYSMYCYGSSKTIDLVLPRHRVKTVPLSIGIGKKSWDRYFKV